MLTSADFHIQFFLTILSKITKFHSHSTAIKTQRHTQKYLRIGTPHTTTFPFLPNGKQWLLGVPIFKHAIIKL